MSTRKGMTPSAPTSTAELERTPEVCQFDIKTNDDLKLFGNQDGFVVQTLRKLAANQAKLKAETAANKEIISQLETERIATRKDLSQLETESMGVEKLISQLQSDIQPLHEVMSAARFLQIRSL